MSLSYRTTWDFSSVQTATAIGSKELLSQDHHAQHVFLSQGAVVEDRFHGSLKWLLCLKNNCKGLETEGALMHNAKTDWQVQLGANLALLGVGAGGLQVIKSPSCPTPHRPANSKDRSKARVRNRDHCSWIPWVISLGAVECIHHTACPGVYRVLLCSPWKVIFVLYWMHFVLT